MGKRRGKGRAVKNAKHALNNEETEDLTRAPHSFIIHRGKLGKRAKELMLNFRKVMEPYTASNLKVQKRNSLKDFVHIAGPLNVSHLVVFTKSEVGMYLRTIKLPRGPTLTFQIKDYSLTRDVISSQRKPLVYKQLFNHHPLLVLNQFSGEGMHLKLMTTMFQNMFPSININNVSLNKIRRCMLFNYNNDKTIDLRHYAIKIVPTGMSKAVKKLIQSKVPNMSQYHDISEFLQKSGNLSDSEAEIDNALNTVTLPQHISSRGNIASEKSAIRLYELGPRITMQLIKIEEGIMSGEVLFHEFFTKTPGEVKVLRARIEAKKRLKEQRRSTQQKNVERKKKEIKEGKYDEEEEEKEEDSAEEDIEWYEKEVGEKPDEDFTTSMKRKTKIGGFIRTAKKAKLQEDTKSASKSPKSFQDVLALRKKKKQAKEKKLQKKKKMHK